MAGKVGIVGAGLVGAAAGYLLALTSGVREVVLLDLDAARAASEAADIAHAASFASTAVVQSGSYADLAGADVVVITAGVSLKPGQTRLDLLATNARIVSGIIEQVLKAAPETVLLFASNPVDVMPALAVRRFGVPPGRAIGTGCALDSARFRDRLAREFGIAPQSMHAYVLGEHGDSEVLHWSGAHVAAMPLARFADQVGRPLTAELRATITQEVRTSAYRIKEGKGVSNFGIGGCIARLTQALVNGENTIFTVSTFAEEVLGVHETCISLPHMLGVRGASPAMLPPLDAVEAEALRHSAEVIREAIAVALG